LADLAAQTASETERAIPPPTANPATATDLYGRTFDPELHMHSMDGTPAIKKNTGHLICKPGKGLGGAARVKRTSAAVGNSSTSTLNLGPIDKNSDAFKETELNVQQLDESLGKTPTETDAAPQPMDSATLHTKATIGGTGVKRALKMFGRWLAGTDGEYQDVDGENEGQEIQETWANWLESSGHAAKIGDLDLAWALLASSRYLQRCWQSDRHQARMKGKKLEPQQPPRTGAAPQSAPQEAGPAPRTEEGPPEMNPEYF
jgi:hypothetical protein